MTQTIYYSKADCLQKLEAAGEALRAYLAGLDEARMTGPQDAAGWTLKDHLVHLSVWEESIVRLFQGVPRYQTLGVTEALYEAEKLDEINAQIYRNWLSAMLAEVLKRLFRVHAEMLAQAQSLSDGDLNQTMEACFPQFSLGDERRLAYVILGNSEFHFLEHLAWMRAISG